MLVAPSLIVSAPAKFYVVFDTRKSINYPRFLKFQLSKSVGEAIDCTMFKRYTSSPSNFSELLILKLG